MSAVINDRKKQIRSCSDTYARKESSEDQTRIKQSPRTVTVIVNRELKNHDEVHDDDVC